MSKKEYEYVIYVEEKEVWRGRDPRIKYDEIKKKYPNKRVGIAWEPGEMTLVACKVQVFRTRK